MYRTLDCGWADDPKVRQLPPNGMLLFVYLIANRLSHVSGIYFLPDAMVMDALKLDRRTLDTLWHTLSSAGLARRDQKTSVVLVPQMFKRQGRGEKNQRAAANQLLNLHNSFLIREFLAIYPEVERYVSDTLSIGHPSQGESGIPDQDQDQDQEKEHARAAEPLSSCGLPAGFQEFWDAYPSKVAKGAALKAWEKTRSRRPPLPDLLAAVERYRTSEKVAEGFVANPSTWLTQERWTDAPPSGRLNLQPRQNGNGPPLEQYRLQILDELNRLRKDRGESWYDQVAEDVHRAKTKADLEALLH